MDKGLCALCGISYVSHGKLNATVFTYEGEIITGGEYKGFFPVSYPAADNSLLSPINLDEYFGYWSKDGNAEGIPELTPESNALLLKWKLKG